MNEKYIDIVLDKPRRLLFNINSMVEFERVTGKNFFEFASTMSKMSASDFRAFLWSCLIHEDKDLTLEQVGEMISMGNFEEIQKSLLKVQEINSPKAEAKNEDSVPLA